MQQKKPFFVGKCGEVDCISLKKSNIKILIQYYICCNRFSHEKSNKKALNRAKIKYKIYIDNIIVGGGMLWDAIGEIGVLEGSDMKIGEALLYFFCFFPFIKILK